MHKKTENTAARKISHRTRGSGHGSIVRLMSPSDLGQVVKPFVFLDLFDGQVEMIEAMPIHPHSGISTVTLILEGNLRFDDVDSGQGMIAYGGVEWMRAGGGVWHGKEMSAGTSERIRGYQLWIALPPKLENGPVDSQYLEADKIPAVGPARVILGEYEGIKSPVRAPEGMNYLLMTLAAGEQWAYHPPQGYDTAWISVSRGAITVPDKISAGDLVAFEAGNGSINIQADAQSGAVFVLGAAVHHPHDLKLGNYSVHTSDDALRAGESRIAELKKRLNKEGVRRGASGATPIFK